MLNDLTTITASSATISWQNGDSKSFEIRLRHIECGSAPHCTKIIPTQSASCVFRELDPAPNTYKVDYLLDDSTFGKSLWSDSVLFKTKPLQPSGICILWQSFVGIAGNFAFAEILNTMTIPPISCFISLLTSSAVNLSKWNRGQGE